MVRSHKVMVWSHLEHKKGLVVVVVSGWWQTKFNVSPGPGQDLTGTWPGTWTGTWTWAWQYCWLLANDCKPFKKLSSSQILVVWWLVCTRNVTMRFHETRNLTFLMSRQQKHSSAVLQYSGTYTYKDWDWTQWIFYTIPECCWLKRTILGFTLW